MKPFECRKLFHFQGYKFRDLETQQNEFLYTDQLVQLQDNTPYFIMIDENNFVINAVETTL